MFARKANMPCTRPPTQTPAFYILFERNEDPERLTCEAFTRNARMLKLLPGNKVEFKVRPVTLRSMSKLRWRFRMKVVALSDSATTAISSLSKGMYAAYFHRNKNPSPRSVTIRYPLLVSGFDTSSRILSAGNLTGDGAKVPAVQ